MEHALAQLFQSSKQNLEELLFPQEVDVETQSASTKQAFVEKYQHNRALFIADHTKAKPHAHQETILSLVDQNARVCIRGPHGLGKTALASWVIWHFLIVSEVMGVDWKIIATASVNRQLERYLFPEVHKWFKSIKWTDIPMTKPTRDEMLIMSIKMQHGQLFSASPEDPALIEGAHATNLLYVIDEAKAVSDGVFDSIEGAFASEGHKDNWMRIFCMSTPGDTTGRFWKISTEQVGSGEWKTFHVTQQMCLDAGTMTREWAENKRNLWGASSIAYITRVLGEFVDSDNKSLIGRKAFNQALKNYSNEGNFVALGCDIGDVGKDFTVFGNVYFENQAYNIYLEVIEKKERPLMDAVVAIKRKVQSQPSLVIAVDTIGVGSGVKQRFEELMLTEKELSQCSLEPFVAGSTGEFYDGTGELKFNNLRSFAAWELQHALNNNQVTVAIDDIYQDRLFNELTQISFSEISNGILVLKPKKTMKKDLGHSPDFLDALMIALYAGKLNDGDNGFWFF